MLPPPPPPEGLAPPPARAPPPPPRPPPPPPRPPPRWANTSTVAHSNTQPTPIMIQLRCLIVDSPLWNRPSAPQTASIASVAAVYAQSLPRSAELLHRLRCGLASAKHRRLCRLVSARWLTR